jgi:acetyltransferase-like isoleucine patch superfamily enzyme
MATSIIDPVPSPAPVAVIAPATKSSPVKLALKRALHGLATVAVSPWLVCYWLSAALLGRDRAIEGVSQSLALLPGLSGAFLRRAFLARVLARCHPSAEVCFGTLFSQTGARLDENVYVGPRCHLGLVHLEQDVLVAAGVHIPSGGQTHYADDPSRPIREQGGERRMVRIGAGSWIGSAAIILADVGRGTIVGAGSVVTKPLPDFVIAAGVPAKVIRPRFAQGSGTFDEGVSA